MTVRNLVSGILQMGTLTRRAAAFLKYLVILLET